MTAVNWGVVTSPPLLLSRLACRLHGSGIQGRLCRRGACTLLNSALTVRYHPLSARTRHQIATVRAVQLLSVLYVALRASPGCSCRLLWRVPGERCPSQTMTGLARVGRQMECVYPVGGSTARGKKHQYVSAASTILSCEEFSDLPMRCRRSRAL